MQQRQRNLSASRAYANLALLKRLPKLTVKLNRQSRRRVETSENKTSSSVGAWEFNFFRPFRKLRQTNQPANRPTETERVHIGKLNFKKVKTF